MLSLNGPCSGMSLINDLHLHTEDDAFCTGKIFAGNKIYYHVGREGYVAIVSSYSYSIYREIGIPSNTRTCFQCIKTHNINREYRDTTLGCCSQYYFLAELNRRQNRWSSQ